MKLWIFSDLHLEYAPLREPLAIPDADVCVVAGDLCRGPANGVRWLAEHIAPSMPCVYVAGNHEFYKGSIREGLEEGRRAAQELSGTHFLENDTVTINGIAIGATLWTNYRIEGHQLLAMRHSREGMNDYRQIALQRKTWQRFVPEAAGRMHQDSGAHRERLGRRKHSQRCRHPPPAAQCITAGTLQGRSRQRRIRVRPLGDPPVRPSGALSTRAHT